MADHQRGDVQYKQSLSAICSLAEVCAICVDLPARLVANLVAELLDRH